MLRIPPVGDQRIGQFLQRLGIRRRRLGRHGTDSRVWLIRARWRRPFLSDFAALRPVPPIHRIHRAGRGTSGHQADAGSRYSGSQPVKIPGLNRFRRAFRLHALYTQRHMLGPLSLRAVCVAADVADAKDV
jgi:hypothetical protein